MNSMVDAPHAFAGELYRWRQRRRVSQLELAARAGTTQRHVSYIEQGRSQPGRDMVMRLAQALELTLRERNALLFVGGYAPLFAESRLDDEMLRPVRDALKQILVGHLPYPAMIVGPTGELVAANAAVNVLAEGAAPELLEPPINVLRLAVHPDGMGRRVQNLGEWGRHIVENVRARALRSPNPGLDALAAELEGLIPKTVRRSGHLGFAVPLQLRCEEGELRLMTTLTSFATALDVTLAELHLEAFLPADASTSQILLARTSRPGAATGGPLPRALVVGAA